MDSFSLTMFSNTPQLPLLIVETVYQTNRRYQNVPWYIEARANPLFSQEYINNLDYIDAVLDTIRNETVNLLRRNNIIRQRRSDTEMDSIAKGLMVISGPMARDFYCNPQFYPLFNGSTSLLIDQIANLIQSNDTVTVRELVFRFEFDERIRWGAGNGKIPPGISKRVSATWEDQYLDGIKLNCAVYAIVHRIFKNSNVNTRKRYWRLIAEKRTAFRLIKISMKTLQQTNYLTGFPMSFQNID